MSTSVVPHGGGSLRARDWLEVIDTDYLQTFIREGGAAVKVVVPGSEQTGSAVTEELRRRAEAAGLAVSQVDASTTRVHLVDQLFGEISRQVDWRHVARAWLTRAYSDLAISGIQEDLTMSAVARREGRDVAELQRGVRTCLERLLVHDGSLSRGLRTAVLRLAQVEAAFPDNRPEDATSALAWLRGEKTSPSTLRRLGLAGRVDRSSALPLLVGLGAVIAGAHQAGMQGLVVCIDVRRLAVSRRPVPDDRTGMYYSKAGVLDAWEVLRQVIDSTEAMTSTLVVVVMPPELLVDEARGLPAYSALQLRIADEVRDRRRANPYAAMVRLDVRLEAVPGLAS